MSGDRFVPSALLLQSDGPRHLLRPATPPPATAISRRNWRRRSAVQSNSLITLRPSMIDWCQSRSRAAGISGAGPG